MPQLFSALRVLGRHTVMKSALAPPWREVLRELRRLEARGEIRGGRFVAGFLGEQFARPEAVHSLRAARREPGRASQHEPLRISAADPLNLIGIVTPGARVSALSGDIVEVIGSDPADVHHQAGAIGVAAS